MKQIGAYFLALLFSGGTAGVLVSLAGMAKRSSSREPLRAPTLPFSAVTPQEQASPLASMTTDTPVPAPRKPRKAQTRARSGNKAKRATQPAG